MCVHIYVCVRMCVHARACVCVRARAWCMCACVCIRVRARVWSVWSVCFVSPSSKLISAALERGMDSKSRGDAAADAWYAVRASTHRWSKLRALPRELSSSASAEPC